MRKFVDVVTALSAVPTFYRKEHKVCLLFDLFLIFRTFSLNDQLNEFSEK